MQRQLTDFLLRIGAERGKEAVNSSGGLQLSSSQLITRIYSTINAQENYRDGRNHKFSLCSEDTNVQSPLKCSCKKSKCLKLYCECFARGSFCVDCNCESCQNTVEFSEVRAKAIDEMIVKANLPFGSKLLGKGCNCKKTGCAKKYCQCYSQGMICNQYCKCSNCENCKQDSN